MSRAPHFLPRLALSLSLVVPPVAGQAQLEVGDDELEPLGASFAAYFEARATGRGLDGAREGFATSLAALKSELAGGDPLAFPTLVGRALWLSHGYADRQRKIKAGKVTTDELEGGSFDGSPLAYAYRVPRDYDPTLPYPLILAIPDSGEEPADHIRDDWKSPEVRDAAIVVCPEMPGDDAAWDQVVIEGRPGGLCNLLTALRLAGARFAVDFDRVFVVGRGVGVATAVALGNYSPQRFAGIVGRAGPLGTLGAENFRDLPTYFVGAGATAMEFQESVKAAGYDNCRVEAVGGEELWSWMKEHPRSTWPTTVTVVPGNPFPTRAYWLRVAPCTPTPRATGKIDRGSNLITVDGEGVSQVTLFLSDELVDLGRPVTVLCNGVENVVEPTRHLPTMLNLVCDGTSDEGCVYVAEVLLDMSGDPARAYRRVPVVEDVDYRRLLGQAGERPSELWEVHEWCLANGREEKAPAVLRRLLRFAPDDLRAREALGHVRVGERWFTSGEAAESFRRRQDPELAKALGLVEHRSLWMHPEERARASKGQVRDEETGLWLDAADRRRLEKGWVLQDTEWISPEEASRVDEGLWRVDGEWLDLASANRRRSRIESMWVIPTAEVRLHATVDRDVAFRALHEMRRAIGDLDRVFGVRPVLPLPVAVLRDEEQYDRFAFGNPDGRRRATHGRRLHVIHSAFFAESWVPLVDGGREFRGMGVCYWDTLMPGGDLYGVHSARLAVGLSYVDALDPSPKAVRGALKAGPGGDYVLEYEAEKLLPAWLRYGAAVYGERFFRDETVGADGDPWWARKWSLENLAARGGLQPLSEVFAFPLNPDDRDGSLKLLIEAGLVVSFLVDGQVAEVKAAHEDFMRAMRSGRITPGQVGALAEVLLAHEGKVREYAEGK